MQADRVTVSVKVSMQPLALITVRLAMYWPGAPYLCVLVAVARVSEVPSPYCHIQVLMVEEVSTLLLVNSTVLSHCPGVVPKFATGRACTCRVLKAVAEQPNLSVVVRSTVKNPTLLKVWADCFCADRFDVPEAGSPKFQLKVISESAGAAGVSSCGLNCTGSPKQVWVVVISTVSFGGTHTSRLAVSTHPRRSSIDSFTW